MKPIIVLVIAALQFIITAPTASAAVVYDQPPNAAGAIYQSSWMEPDGSDYDYFVWDAFTLASDQTITELRWRGAYLYGGMFSPSVESFTIAIYPSIAAGTEPDVVHPPLVEYETVDDCAETVSSIINGTATYEYSFVLPAPFNAAGGVKYWIYVVAWQPSIPEWGFISASGGDGSHFRRHSEYMFQMVPGDCAFSLIGPAPACPADLTNDGAVGPFDLATLLAQWGPCPSSPCAADLAPAGGGDGVIGPADLAQLLANWGSCP